MDSIDGKFEVLAFVPRVNLVRGRHGLGLAQIADYLDNSAKARVIGHSQSGSAIVIRVMYDLPIDTRRGKPLNLNSMLFNVCVEVSSNETGIHLVPSDEESVAFARDLRRWRNYEKTLTGARRIAVNVLVAAYTPNTQ